MNNKEKYRELCENTYVPIYSKPWWMDAVCGEENWDVWILEENGHIDAAMPYYVEKRDKYIYITKAPLTQNNGIIFNYPEGCSELAKIKFEERVIEHACKYIESLGVDVYEQQYEYTFKNWLPFFWKYYKAIVRYTNRIEKKSIEQAWSDISNRKRRNIKKGEKNARIESFEDTLTFYKEHRKVFLKQGLDCPFSYELFKNLVDACKDNNAGQMYVARNRENIITALIFVVWDEKNMYYLIGGGIPEYQKEESFSFLMWTMIKDAINKELSFDFEGSVIPRIAKSNREYGAAPIPYFRIRKVFNKEIMIKEVQMDILRLESEEK